MRITSGIARGISLLAPKGDMTRPATDAARLAVFSSLAGVLEDSYVVDLFAGTGSYGLEAASRGANYVTFVEKEKRAALVIKQNIEAVKKAMNSQGFNPQLNLKVGDVFKFVNPIDVKPNFVFADPPYALLFDKVIIKKIYTTLSKIADEKTTFVLESPAEFELVSEFFNEQLQENFNFSIINRLGKKSKGKPTQIIFKIAKQ